MNIYSVRDSAGDIVHAPMTEAQGATSGALVSWTPEEYRAEYVARMQHEVNALCGSTDWMARAIALNNLAQAQNTLIEAVMAGRDASKFDPNFTGPMDSREPYLRG